MCLVLELIDVYVCGLTQEINMDLELLIIYNVFKIVQIIIGIADVTIQMTKRFKCSTYRYCRFGKLKSIQHRILKPLKCYVFYSNEDIVS